MNDQEILDICSRLDIRICLDVSHAKMFCNHSGQDFYEYLQSLKNVTAHREWPSLIAKNAIKNELIIRDQKGEYTSEYKALCQPFYLKF